MYIYLYKMDDFIDSGCRYELEQTLPRILELEHLDQRNANRIEELEEEVEMLKDYIKELKPLIHNLIKKTGGGV
jgi:predicted RNase H-like nuclease (RuvC/YqgF family)